MRKLAVGASLLGLMGPVLAGPAKAGPVGWDALAQSPGGLSAVATGIEMLGRCRVPLAFEQTTPAADSVHITITCANTGDGAGSVIVKFSRFPGAKALFAQGFEFEG
jgi:hypothetical protein